MTDMLTENEMTKVQNIVMEQLEVKRAQVAPEASLKADLGADSLDIAEIAMKLEEQFSLTASDGDLDGIETVDDLYEMLGKLLGRAG